MDRFIPNRSAMDFDYAQYMLRESPKLSQEDLAKVSPYQRSLREAFNMNPARRILVFGKTPPSLVESSPLWEASSLRNSKPVKPQRHVRREAERILDAPDFVDDYYLNLLGWSNNNVLAIALGSTVYLWDASTSLSSELVSVDDEMGPVTSVSWAPGGHHIAIGLNNSEVQLWDTCSSRRLRTLRGGHGARVGSLDWNKHILTMGGMDGRIIDHDVRVRDHIVGSYRGHYHEVCGLKWSTSGRQLASGGSDNLLFIWDRSMASSKWLYKLQDHKAAVKALDWCTFQGNLLASGGGVGDHSIKFWNTQTGACLNSVETGSQVCALVWSKHERELLSSHGFSGNNMILWKYPSMMRMAELDGHSSRVLHMVQSPDGCTVASLSADETLRFWNVFETLKAAKPQKDDKEPFAYVSCSRIR